jgi:hypothetical protein
MSGDEALAALPEFIERMLAGKDPPGSSAVRGHVEFSDGDRDGARVSTMDAGNTSSPDRRWDVADRLGRASVVAADASVRLAFPPDRCSCRKVCGGCRVTEVWI